MGYGFKAAAGGGSNLNFSVKTYVSEEALLAAAPKENTIGVVTDTAVPKWGFYAAAPEAPAEGEIFFTVATESAGSFNALKKNALTVYPTLCQQSVSGEWARKIAYICKSGAWVQFSTLWNGELFEQGNVHADVTGGWNKSEGSSGTEVAITNSTTGNTISPSNGGTMYMYTVNKVDVTNWNTLTFVVSAKNGSDNMRLGISTSQKRPTSDGGFDKLVYAGSAGTYNLDISAITGSVYVTMYLWGSFAINSIYMTK